MYTWRKCPKRITSHVTIATHTEERGIQTYFPKVVKCFRTVTTQTDNNNAINILNNKKVHPEDIYKHWIIIMEDNNFSMGPIHVNLP